MPDESFEWVSNEQGSLVRVIGEDELISVLKTGEYSSSSPSENSQTPPETLEEDPADQTPNAPHQDSPTGTGGAEKPTPTTEAAGEAEGQSGPDSKGSPSHALETLTDEDLAALERRHQVLLFLYAPWCRSCNTYKPIFLDAAIKLHNARVRQMKIIPFLGIFYFLILLFRYIHFRPYPLLIPLLSRFLLLLSLWIHQRHKNWFRN